MRVRNQKGVVLMDFLLSFTLTFFLFSVFMIFAFAINVISISQYIAYSGARNYFAAHHDSETQRQRALHKILTLKNHPVFQPFYKDNGWFEMGEPGVGYRGDLENNKKDIFEGVWFSLVVKILDFRVPFLGSTGDEESAFSTQVRAFLGREVTQKECQQFNEDRLSKIREVFGMSLDLGRVSKSYADNGC